MKRGIPLIYQAALTAGSWLGYADFLIRVEDDCPRWGWSYEPWDAKLAFYGDLLATVQGRAAHRGCLMLGTGQPETPYRVRARQPH
jgi:hypothetical protein